MNFSNQMLKFRFYFQTMNDKLATQTDQVLLIDNLINALQLEITIGILPVIVMLGIIIYDCKDCLALVKL